MTDYDPSWIEEDKKRVIQMNEWYELDGRSNPSHPFHSLFTGLNGKYGEKEVSKP